MEPVDVLKLVQRGSGGDPIATDELAQTLYDELRRTASAQLQKEAPGHTLQPTALVHEAFLRLVDQDRVDWKGRTHFLAICAQAMRRVLIDHARARGRVKRGGGRKRAELDESLTVSRYSVEDVVAVDELLERLAELSPQQSQIVELRFFAGMTSAEVSEHLGVSKSTVDRQWRMARAWLRRELSEEAEP